MRALAFHDVSMRRVAEPGTTLVTVGASSEDVRLAGRFEIVGQIGEGSYGTVFKARDT